MIKKSDLCWEEIVALNEYREEGLFPTYPPKYTIKDINCKSIEDVKYVLSMNGKIVATFAGFDFNIESVKDNYLVTKGTWGNGKFLLQFDKCKVVGSY